MFQGSVLSKHLRAPQKRNFRRFQLFQQDKILGFKLQIKRHSSKR